VRSASVNEMPASRVTEECYAVGIDADLSVVVDHPGEGVSHVVTVIRPTGRLSTLGESVVDGDQDPTL